MAVSSINASYSVASVARTKVQSKELVFAKAKISINGVSVQIGGSVEETARKINRIKDKTGVEARIVTNSGGVKTIQLVLKRGNSLRINDQDGVLKGLVGTTDKHLIKVIKTNGQSKVLLQYTNTQEHHNNTKELYLRSSDRRGDSGKKVNNQPLPQIDGPEEDMEPLDIEPLEAVGMLPIPPEEIPVPVVRNVHQALPLDAVEVEPGQDPLSIMINHEDPYRLQEQERLEQERMKREYLEGMKRIRERREVLQKTISDCANGSLKKVLSVKKLTSTPEEVHDVVRWVAEAIDSCGLRERTLVGRGAELIDLISKEIINKRGFWANNTSSVLKISEIDTKAAVGIAISKLK